MPRKPKRKTFTKPVGELKDRVIFINRVTKVVAGGKRLNFTALVVVGDEQGHVGFGKGKAREVPMAIQKAIKRARKNLIEVPLVGTTIPYEVIGRHDAGMVLLKPASRGTGVIAGGPVRAVLELAGIRDVLTKSMRSNNPFAVVRATFDALMSLHSPEEIAALRKKKLSEFYRPPAYAQLDLVEQAEEEKGDQDEIVAVIRPDDEQAQSSEESAEEEKVEAHVEEASEDESSAVEETQTEEEPVETPAEEEQETREEKTEESAHDEQEGSSVDETETDETSTEQMSDEPEKSGGNHE